MLLGQRIARIRRQKNIPQKTLAKGIVSQSHLSNVESGRFTPHTEILTCLATHLKVPKSYLIDTEQENQQLASYLICLTNALKKSNVIYASKLIETIETQYEYINSLNRNYYFSF
jgi:transcriptional regulator with XRE-family HTH domain